MVLLFKVSKDNPRLVKTHNDAKLPRVLPITLEYQIVTVTNSIPVLVSHHYAAIQIYLG